MISQSSEEKGAASEQQGAARQEKEAAPLRDQNQEQGQEQGQDLGKRLERLKKQLDTPEVQALKTVDAQESDAEKANRNTMAQAFRLSSEFIAGIVAGGVIGYLVDRFFHTTPWGLIIFLLLGFAAAILNVLRAAGMVAESEMRLKPAYEMQKSRKHEETGKKMKK